MERPQPRVTSPACPAAGRAGGVDGLCLPLPGEETKAHREGRRWEQDQTHPWQWGAAKPHRFVFLFSKLVCHRGGRGRPFRLGPSPTWPGHSSSFTPERTAADLGGHRVPRAPSSNTTLSLGPRVLLLENPPLSPRCSGRGIHIRTPLFCWVDFFQENACVG